MLEMRGITQAVPRRGRQRPRRLRRAGRRGAHALRRERRRQEHADAGPVRPLPARRGRDPRSTGEPVAIASPAAAIRHGIGMIHQHFMLVNTLTVAENVALGLRSLARPLTDLAAVSRADRGALEPVRPRRRPEGRGLAALGRRAPARRDHQGALPQRVAADPRRADGGADAAGGRRPLRRPAADGRTTAGASCSSRTRSARCSRSPTGSRCSARAGRSATVTPARGDAARARRDDGRPRAAGRGACRPPQLGRRPAWRCAACMSRRPRHRGRAGTSILDVREGEIVGIAGVSGNGQRELAEAIAGLRPVVSGSAVLDGIELVGRHPAEMRAAGLGYVPEERMRDGVVGDFTVGENLLLIDNADAPFAASASCRRGDIRRRCDRAGRGVRREDARRSTRRPATCRGGNIQKLILARELSARPRVLLVAQPTRGVDVGAAAYIHERLLRAARRGHGDPRRLRGSRRGALARPTGSSSCTRARSSPRPTRREHPRGARADDGRRALTSRAGGPTARAVERCPGSRGRARRGRR